MRAYLVERFRQFIVEVAVVASFRKFEHQFLAGILFDDCLHLRFDFQRHGDAGFGAPPLNTTIDGLRKRAEVYGIETAQHERKHEEVAVPLHPRLQVLRKNNLAQCFDAHIAFCRRIGLDAVAAVRVEVEHFMVDGIVDDRFQVSVVHTASVGLRCIDSEELVEVLNPCHVDVREVQMGGFFTAEPCLDAAPSDAIHFSCTLSETLVLNVASEEFRYRIRVFLFRLNLFYFLRTEYFFDGIFDFSCRHGSKATGAIDKVIDDVRYLHAAASDNLIVGSTVWVF